MTTSEQQAVPVAQIDWGLIAKAAGEHGVRYRTNRAMLRFLAAIEPARKADRFDPAHPCKSGEGETLDRPALLAAAHAWWARNMPDSHFKTATIKGDGRVDVHWQDSEESGSYTLPVNFTALTPDATQTREAEAERILEAFNGGLVDIPDAANPRGFTTVYRPLDAMSAALNARGGA